jgi:hypothetical protein
MVRLTGEVMSEQGDPGPAVEAVSAFETERKKLARERATRALELRKAGYTYARIQSTLKYNSISGVQTALKAALKWTLSDSADEVRALEVERLDMLLQRCVQIMSLVNVPKKDDGTANPYYQDFDLLFKAIDRLLLINIRRSKLLGLEVPPQTALLMAEYQKLFDQFSKLVSEVGGIIVKEAPADVAHRILEKIASFQAASAGSMAGTLSAAAATNNGMLSETALNLTHVTINAPGTPAPREIGPAIDVLPVPADSRAELKPLNWKTDGERRTLECEQEGESLEGEKDSADEPE